MRLKRLVGIVGFLFVLLICLVSVVFVFGVFAKEARSRQELSRREGTNAGPILRTDKESYVAGEAITISGTGFAPLESVMLQVKHAGGTAETGMGHEPFWVYANADGAIDATWSLDVHDTAGVDLAIEAAGSSGSNARAAFTRRGSITTDRLSYRRGDTARIRADGFTPGELVTLEANGESLTTLSDESGRVTTNLNVSEDTGVNSFAIKIAGASGVIAATTVIANEWIVIRDTGGVNDVNSDQVDLTLMARIENNASVYQLLGSWDSINSWTGSGQTGDACALFDVDSSNQVGYAKADYAVCARVSNPNGDPNVVKIVKTPLNRGAYLFSCSITNKKNQRNDRCANPLEITTLPSGTLIEAGAWVENPPSRPAVMDPDANLITNTDPFPGGQSYNLDSTVEVHVSKSLVGNGRLINWCSYPSAGSGGNNNPFDCIINPDTGFLVIKKNIGTATSTDTFTFDVTPNPTLGDPAAISGNSETAAMEIGFTSAGKVQETNLSSSWALANAVCKLEGTSGINTGATTGTFSPADKSVDGIKIEPARTTYCEFFNDPVAPKITLIKNVTNNSGGSAVATDFALSATGATSSFSNQTLTAMDSGSYSSRATTGEKIVAANVQYTLGENGPGGYAQGPWSCDGGTYFGPNQISLSYGTKVTCQVTNDDLPGTLIVKKIVLNNSGGTKSASDFSFKVNGGSATAFEADGQNDLTVNAGTYSVVEPAVTGYTTTYDNCSNLVIANGASATCTITNDDQPATLIVKKIVNNDKGGTKTASDFSFKVNGDTAIPFEADGQNNLTVNAGTYTITEPADTAYTTTYENCSGVVIANGASATCTITNTAKANTPVGTTEQRWILRDFATFSIVKNAPNAGSARVQFSLYKDNDGVFDAATTCGSGGTLMGAAEEVPVNQDGEATTANGFLVTVPGLYAWVAHYTGDQFNNPASTACGDELTLIKAKDKNYTQLP